MIFVIVLSIISVLGLAVLSVPQVVYWRIQHIKKANKVK